MNRTILEKAKCMRAHADLPKSLLAEAASTACYVYRGHIGGTPQDVVLWRKWGGPLGPECADWLAPCPGPLPLAEPGHVQW